MGTTDKLAVMRRFAEIINSGELDDLDEVFAPDYALRNAQTMGLPLGAGLDIVKQGFARIHRAFPDDAEWTLEPVVENGDTMVASWMFRGTNTGPYDNLEPTGRSVTYPVIGVYRIKDGRIFENWGLFDTLALWRELIPEIGDLVDKATE
jgi:predicted ester cyclase